MSGYIGATPVPQATQHREAFTATASQTSFATAGYTPQFLDVYLNGVKLAAADYTATNGSDIVLTTGAALDDILEYVAYTPFEVADQTFTGTTTLTDSGAAPLFVNRTTSDGDITTFQKDGTTVGSIGVNSNRPYFEKAAAGGITISSSGGNPIILPTSGAGALSDGLATIGSPAYRFNNIYTSGAIYLGGTVSANALDDYEEGTWTPVVGSNGGGSTSAGSFHGSYTKIGKSVTILFHVANFTYSGGSGNLEITGLPFTPVISDSRPTRGGNVAFYKYDLPDTGYGYVVPEVADTGIMIFRVTVDNGIWAAVVCKNSNGLYVEGSMTYFTA